MNIDLYKFTKSANSTKQPASIYKTIPVKLKENCSIYNPVFIVSTTDNILEVNYCRFNGKYYYVQDIIITANQLYELTCRVDVLATYKGGILSNSLYVLYSSSHHNDFLPDTRLSTRSKPSTSRSSQYMTWTSDGLPSPTNDVLSGYYCITYVGEGSNTFAYVKDDGLRAIQTKLCSSDFITAMSDVIGKAMGDTSQCITSCRYVHHISPTGFQDIVFPNGYVAYSGAIKSARVDNGVNKVKIPWQFPLNDFRNRSEYTKLIMKLPFYGTIDIDPNQVFGLEEITVEYSCDCVTGDLVYTIPELGYPKFPCCFGFDVQLSTTSTPSLKESIGGIVSNGIDTVASIVTKDAVGAVVSGTQAIGGIISNFAKTPSCVGGNQSCASIDIEESFFNITSYTYPVINDLSIVATHMGRPCNEVLRLSSLSGYCECICNKIQNVSAPNNIQEEIINLLNNGILIE